jgi:UDP:flavonoid glycosyltransferase YjiC (YdhE family)
MVVGQWSSPINHNVCELDNRYRLASKKKRRDQTRCVERYGATIQACDLVACHGGNGTIYQSLSDGLHIVGLATHEEQHYGLKRVNQLELGIGFKADLLERKGFGL